ncbi:MAG: FeoB-associated Cys-rich membrane protein [Thermodesulfobacteriota bacterium]
MDMILVVMAVGLAVFFIGRMIYRKFKTPQAIECGCGCSSCGIQSDCDSERKVH